MVIGLYRLSVQCSFIFVTHLFDAIVNHYERAISLLDQGGLIEKDGDMLKIVQQSSNLKEITTQEEPPAQPQRQTRPGKQKVKIRIVQL